VVVVVVLVVMSDLLYVFVVVRPVDLGGEPTLAFTSTVLAQFVDDSADDEDDDADGNKDNHQHIRVHP